MEKYSLVVNGLVEVGFALQIGLAAVLFVKQLWRKFPCFTLYSIASILLTTAYYAIHQYRSVYFYSYWVLESIGVMLGLAVVYEIFKHLLAGQPALNKLARRVFQGVVLALGALGAAVIFLQWPSSAQGISNGVFVVEESARVVEIGLLMFLFLFSSVFGLHWRRHEFGIALGLGIFVAVQLTVVTMRAHVGLIGADTLNVIRIVSFDSSLLMWLGYILIPERVASQAELPQRAQLEQWNQAMMELINQ